MWRSEVKARALLRRIEYEHEVQRIRSQDEGDRRACKRQIHLISCVWECWCDQKAESVRHRAIIIRVAKKILQRMHARACGSWRAFVGRSRAARKAAQRWTKRVIGAAWDIIRVASAYRRRQRHLGRKLTLRWRNKGVYNAWTSWCHYRLRSAMVQKSNECARRRWKNARLVMAMGAWDNQTTHRKRCITAAKKALSIGSRRAMCRHFKEWALWLGQILATKNVPSQNVMETCATHEDREMPQIRRTLKRWKIYHVQAQGRRRIAAIVRQVQTVMFVGSLLHCPSMYMFMHSDPSAIYAQKVSACELMMSCRLHSLPSDMHVADEEGTKSCKLGDGKKHRTLYAQSNVCLEAARSPRFAVISVCKACSLLFMM